MTIPGRLFIPVFALLFLLPAAGVAAPATAYSIVTNQPGAPPQLGMGDAVRLQIDGDEPVDTAKMTLRLDGESLGVAPRWEPDQRVLSFPLILNDSNRGLWGRVLGAPFSHGKLVRVMVALEEDGRPLSFHAASAAGPGSPAPEIQVVSYNSGRMAVGLLLALVVIVVTVMLCKKTTMIRDCVVPQLRREDRSFSLSRFQMAIWFCVIFASFVFIFAATGDLNCMTTEGFTLLGISGATALGAVAVDQSKDSVIGRIDSTLSSMGLSTASDAEKIYRAALDASQGANPANTVITGAGLPNNHNPTVKDFWSFYNHQVAPIRTTGFWTDLVNDINGPTVHRWQILIWTLVLAGIYVWNVYVNLQMPILGNQLLTLMGISGGVYVGLKIPERQV